MTTSRTASSILLVLLLAGGLAACAPTAPGDGDTGNDDSSETTDDTGTDDTGSDDSDSDDEGFAGVTVSGTGDYTLPDDMPIGGYEFADADTQPDGCTWSIYVGDSVLAENNGGLVFVTDVTTRFVTEGCPDWVQFE